MSLQANLERICRTEYLSVSKERYRERNSLHWFLDVLAETSEYWLIPCTHLLNAPATDAQIATLAFTLGQDLPVQLRDFLKLADGAALFRLHYRSGQFDYWITRYKVLGCSELLQVNREILEIFHSYAEFDDTYRDVEKLNYLAFCDIGDGNYLAIILEGANTGHVFFLDHEYGFYPFAPELARNAYVHVADSLDEWLGQLARTGGEDGTGGRWIPL